MRLGVSKHYIAVALKFICLKNIIIVSVLLLFLEGVVVQPPKNIFFLHNSNGSSPTVQPANLATRLLIFTGIFIQRSIVYFINLSCD